MNYKIDSPHMEDLGVLEYLVQKKCLKGPTWQMKDTWAGCNKHPYEHWIMKEHSYDWIHKGEGSKLRWVHDSYQTKKWAWER